MQRNERYMISYLGAIIFSLLISISGQGVVKKMNILYAFRKMSGPQMKAWKVASVIMKIKGILLAVSCIASWLISKNALCPPCLTPCMNLAVMLGFSSAEMCRLPRNCVHFCFWVTGKTFSWDSTYE